MKLNLLVVFLFIGQLCIAQNSLTVRGKIVDANSKQPLEFVSVIVNNNKTNQPVTGATTGIDGAFELKTKVKDVNVEISFIGFKTKRITTIKNINGVANLNTIELEEDAQELDEVVVRAEKSSTEFKLDKRVFNVGKDLSSTGASAMEVLNNVPSVNVSIEGAITLRGGQGAQILINGKPSVIASQEGNALGTIVADQIEKIEVITNPSAKYEAEGTAGIINIVLKKNDKKGWNGSISLNTGIPNNHSVGVSLNKRTEKFNIFSQIGVGKRTFPNESKSYNLNRTNNNEILSNGNGDKNEQFYNITLGTDYYINQYNVITLSGNFAYEIEDEDSKTQFDQVEGSNGNLNSSYNRFEITEATNPKFQYELQYKKDFKNNKEQSLLFSALGSFFGKDQTSEFNNEAIVGIADPNQKTRTDFKEAQYTFKLDYTHPITEAYTIETGTQYVLNDVTNDYAVDNFQGGIWVNDVNLTNIFDYKQNVFGVYITGAYEGEQWGVKLGGRLENTDLNTVLQTTRQENAQNYTNFFPSVHTSYKVNHNFSIQAGYSKRIYRPRLWDLNPFFNIRNQFNIFTGNPNLQPEFTDSYELTSIHKLGKLNLNFGVYYRNTTDVIEDVSSYNTTTGVTTRMPQNFGTSKITGFEANYKVNLTKWASVNGDFNYNIFNRKGQFDADNNFDFEGSRWDTKSTVKFKLPESFDLEVSGNYRSKYKTAQGTVAKNVFANLGLRKKIIKGKVILNLSVRDLFASRIFESTQEGTSFFSSSSRQRGRFVTFGISYGFGKGEAMEYSARKRF
ncbi:TonB-dependent receptor [Tenacibaculum sp. 190130A14a]|uniref:Iron complex outermembrane recepter protein n=1 Tax=Tenacibaculum polynesiense TaxID=3137857 RepID=A0ABM9P8E3_9FLAO